MTLHAPYIEGVSALQTYGDTPELLAELAPEAKELLEVVARHAPNAYLVGGVVRDLLLGQRQPGRDLDIVAETPVHPLGVTLQHRLGGQLSCHETFLTCSLALPKVTLDLSTARSERYPHPGALPLVKASDLAHDLHRRDFSVNTFALHLSRPHTLLSVGGAKDDLDAKQLRILHDRSFFDDPTRSVRGSRLAGRLGFSYAPQTARTLAEMLAAEVYMPVSPARFKHELLLTLAERRVAPAVAHLAESGALATLYGLQDTPLIARLDALRPSVAVPTESYLLALLLALSEEDAAAHVRRFSWPQRLLAARRRLAAGDARTRSQAEGVVQRALQPGQMSASYPQLRGSDVLSLGLPAGPEVGRVLEAVARARLDGRVASFAAELELAKRLVHEPSKREKA